MAGKRCPTHGGATTTGPDATYPPAICQNSGGGAELGGGGPAGGGGLAGGQGGVRWGEGRGVRVRVTELVEPVLVL